MKNNGTIGKDKTWKYIAIVHFIVTVFSLALLFTTITLNLNDRDTSHQETSIRLRATTEEDEYEYLVDILPEDGHPILIKTNKVGDNHLPEYHMTYAQLLPYKRHVNDNRVYVYTVIIDNN